MEGITPETGNTIQVGCTTSQNQPNLKIRLENKMMLELIKTPWNIKCNHKTTFARWGRPTFPTRSCGVTVLSTPVLPTTRRPPSMLSPSTTSTGLLQTTWHQGDLFHVSPSPCKEKSIYVLRCSAKDYNERRLSRKSMSSSPGSGSAGNSLEEAEEGEEVGSKADISYLTSKYIFTFPPNISKY